MEDAKTPSLDHIDELKSAENEQTEDEVSCDDIDRAAERRTMDRVIDILAIISRPRRIGCGGFPIDDQAESDVSRMVSAAAKRAIRIFESDMPREIISWD